MGKKVVSKPIETSIFELKQVIPFFFLKEKTSNVQKALRVVLEMLDFACWRSNLDVWKLLKAIIQTLKLQYVWQFVHFPLPIQRPGAMFGLTDRNDQVSLFFTLKQRQLGGCCAQKHEGKKRLVAHAALYQHALHQRLWEPKAFENQIIAGQNPLSW